MVLAHARVRDIAEVLFYSLTGVVEGRDLEKPPPISCGTMTARSETWIPGFPGFESMVAFLAYTNIINAALGSRTEMDANLLHSDSA